MGQDSIGRDRPLVVGLGEALFDCFPECAVLGGAPVNVAVHAHALLAPRGGRAVAATRVGCDELGNRYLSELMARGIDTSVVQADPQHATGTVIVSRNVDGSAEYEFADDVAWDHCEFNDEWRQLARYADAICFGTLAQRSTRSRQAIQAFMSEATAPIRLFDVNLRQQYFDAKVIEDSLAFANAVKLNDDELFTVARLLSLTSGASDTIHSLATHLRERFELDWVVVTRGAQGAILFSADEPIEAPTHRVPLAANADTVGAGDACCAALIVGKLNQWPDEVILDFSMRVASFVASRPGATPQLPSELIECVRLQSRVSELAERSNADVTGWRSFANSEESLVMREELSGVASLEPNLQERDSRGEWIPAAPESYRPVFVWPPQPAALLKWIVAYPGFLFPRHVSYLLISLVTWLWLTPSLERCANFHWDWVGFIYLRNLVLITAYYSFYHVLLYVLKVEDDHGKYNPNWPATKTRKFIFGDQVLDNVFWTAGVGVVVFTAFEVVTWWFYANGYIPMVTWSESPVYCVILLLILPFWREFHFYWTHRLIHWRPLYTHVHYLHHKNHNPNPWSGMAMHPVETIIYFSVVMFNWVVPSSPLHFLFLLQTTALLPAPTHHGFHGPILAGKLPTGSYFHYMHHKFYECNYGGSLIPLDKWFGTFRSSSSRDAAFKSKREGAS